MTTSNNNEFWYLNGNRYQIDEPAVIHSNGINEWYLNGFEFSPKWLPCDYELKYLL